MSMYSLNTKDKAKLFDKCIGPFKRSIYDVQATDKDLDAVVTSTNKIKTKDHPKDQKKITVFFEKK